MKEEKFPHTRKLLHWRRWGVGGENASEPLVLSPILTSTRQTETLVSSPAGAGGGWELRLRLRKSDSKERTGIGCLKTA